MTPDPPTPERWRQIEQLYHAALELRLGEREAFLDEACAGDDELRREVLSLIAAHNRAETFISTPPDDVVAALVAEQQSGSMSGRTLGHYRLDSLLGAGGMGEVWRARDLRLDRDVAVKILPEHLADNPEALRRFEREAKAVAALSHPNILSIFDFGVEQGLSYAVMELLEGGTLRERLNRSGMDWREALEIGIAIAEGLAAAHTRGVIHRDLKPENIFLTSDGQVKILDFGLAMMKRAVSPDAETLTLSFSQTTRPGLVMGTIGYMSPEQVRGEPVEGQSDIFSLGCVLYEAIGGQRPFAHNTVAEVIAAVLKEEPPPLHSRATEVPAEMNRVVSKALRKDRDERYQTAGELLCDLKSLRLESELGARLKSSGNRNAIGSVDSGAVLAARAPAKRLIGLLVAILVLVLGGWGAYRIRFQNQTSAQPDDSAKTDEAGVEALRYYLEIESGRNATTRATGFEPIGGRGFRFHFIPRNRGYLYIITEGEMNLPTLHLTARPLEKTGVTTNLIEAGADYSFPSGQGNKIRLGDFGNTTKFTIIFSPMQLKKPEFLSSRADRPLTADEHREMVSLRRQFGEQTPKTVVKTDGDGVSVAVLVKADRANDRPIIFDIPLKHR
jgi:serine/threonine protein kinase